MMNTESVPTCGIEATREQKHIAIDSSIGSLTRMVDLLEQFYYEMVPPTPRCSEPDVEPKEMPCLETVLINAPDQIHKQSVRIEEIISSMRGVLF